MVLYVGLWTLVVYSVLLAILAAIAYFIFGVPWWMSVSLSVLGAALGYASLVIVANTYPMLEE